MSYIITNDKHYKDIAKSLRSKMQTDREYYPEDMAIAIDNIPSSADGTDNPITGIYFLNPNENGYPTKIKVSGFSLENKETSFPLVFNDKIFKYLETVEFLNCDFKYFQNNAFQSCSNLTSITIPDSLTVISNGAFSGCSNLTTINIPNGVTTIEPWAFNSCLSLTTINIPNSVTFIGVMAFYACYSLVYVAFDDGFNCNGLDLSSSTKYSRETIVSWLNALADRTGQTAYKLTIGATNLAKLTEEDILIATNKNWTLA